MNFRNDQERDDWKACYLAALTGEIAMVKPTEDSADQFIEALREREPATSPAAIPYPTPQNAPACDAISVDNQQR